MNKINNFKFFMSVIGLLLTLNFSIARGEDVPGRKTLVVKKIEAPEGITLDHVEDLLYKNGVKFNYVDCINWANYPFKPVVKFRIAHTDKFILLDFHVEEESIRAVIDKDNEVNCFDSCVEFFLSPTSDDVYYNLESNCTGHILVEYGKKGTKRSKIPDEKVKMIERQSSLGSSPFPEKLGYHTWSLCMLIPVEVFSNSNLQSFDDCEMTGNFYKCGDELKKRHYLTWSPVYTGGPDFHEPQFFGKLIFE